MVDENRIGGLVSSLKCRIGWVGNWLGCVMDVYDKLSEEWLRGTNVRDPSVLCKL